MARIFNTLAPYILTALIRKPKRLVYLSSGMHVAATRAQGRVMLLDDQSGGSDLM